jgi:hypothetical protein
MHDENTPEDNISANQLFTKIWTSPRAVFRFITEHHYDRHVTLLLLLAGIVRAFDRATSKSLGDHFPTATLIALCIIMGGLFGYLINYIYASLISWTGKWVDGKGDTRSILRVIAYAMVPSILSLLFLIPQIAVYGSEQFKAEGDIYSGTVLENVIFYVSLAIEFTLSLYSIVLCVIGVSEVQRISIGKAIINMLLPAAAIILFLIAFTLVTDLFNF